MTFGGTNGGRMKKIMAIAGLLATLLPGQVQAFSYSGRHWEGGNPVQVPVTIQSSVLGAWITPIARSMGAWNNAGAKFRFVAGNADHNVAFKNVWWSTNALAVTYIREIFGPRITDRDTDISSRYPWDIDGRAGSYDIQNVMTHELGHWLTLNDLYGGSDYWKTMYGSAGPGETYKRSLDQDDINGIKSIYGW